MSPDEVVGMAIFFGSVISIIFIITVGSIIKAWVKKDSSKSLTENREFLDALREFKENMESRMSSLEEIVSAEKHHSPSLKSGKKVKNPQSTIKLELEDESPDERKPGEASTLRNMLTQ